MNKHNSFLALKVKSEESISLYGYLILHSSFFTLHLTDALKEGKDFLPCFECVRGKGYGCTHEVARRIA